MTLWRQFLFLLLAVLAASASVPRSTLTVTGYVRLQGAGGIGGLLALSDQRANAANPTNYFYHADGNGNVVALINQRNEVVARYLHDPFGNLLAKSGPMADFNRQQFSSKERHTQSGLILYEFRAYDPNLQRWLNQDPIEEAGGINLYGFVRNNPLRFADPWGLEITHYYTKPGDSLLQPSGPVPYLTGDTFVENTAAGLYNTIPLLNNSLTTIAGTATDAVNNALEGVAGFAGWAAEKLGASSAEADLTKRTVAAAGLVFGPRGRPCPPTKVFPKKATDMVDHLKKNGKPPVNYVGGREFKNREGLLPAGGKYREYDVDPKPPSGQRRNAERIVVDDNTGRAWYTDDHYGSFTEIK